ncbi:PepSY-associated TM helix domain-containing protein [Luteimonas sp. 50]|uniref:PepSY-associated TM helix domain-containing protein n=1 Tax=Cognatiluteimonas sedimenti TaxID=2927791 RepID=A0ABT0A4E7_9GAMM|nr:PepSY-associated TM helix domain-containing protein [Lysobacter sedimenti]MCJ0825846.1 PepSY-associated TM helix domain-containing protein [Lysobacter sedimenti]
MNHVPRARNGQRIHRMLRQLHLWIGAWGALAAIVYGFTGLVMNHRFGENPWPQGDSIDAGRVVLEIPAQARGSAEDLSKWLLQARGLDAQSIRKGAPRGASEGAPGQWSLSGGNARASWALQYQPGDATAEVKHNRQTWLAALNRLHKAVGGGLAWVLLADSFALAMLLLGLSGLWLWARGRSLRQMAMSVFGVSLLVLAAVSWPALA